MATVGQVLPTPEVGWKRIDDINPSIKYTGTGWLTVTGDANTYAGTGTYTTLSGATSNSIRFSFYGTKIRIIDLYWTNRVNNVNVSIDGVSSSYNPNNPMNRYQVLVFESLNLPLAIHEVVITTNSTSNIFSIDAIDIDDNGRLLHPDEVLKPKDLKVGKRIRCHYRAVTNVVGEFSGLGEEIGDFIPVSSSATPNGDFYFIMVDEWNGKKKLIADRNVQHSISWDTLNASGLVTGKNISFKYTGDVTPKMTSNTMISGEKVTASSSYFMTPPYWAFDDVNISPDNNPWLAPEGVSAAWLEFEFPALKQIQAYTIMSQVGAPYVSRSPKDWTFEAFDMVSEQWIVLDRRTGQTSWGSGETRFYSFVNEGKYKRYRINVSANNGNTYLSIGEMEMMEAKPEDINAQIRLLTGAISATDKDNEWDKYIVNSTLNGTITAGNNAVWNWSSVASWTSTTATIASNRVRRGFSSVVTWDAGASSSSAVANNGYRPMLIIEEINLIPSFIYSNGEYKKWIEGNKEVKSSYTDDLIPKMISNNSPSGVVRASSTYSTVSPYLAFDDSNTLESSAWITNSTKTGWLEYEFDLPKTITKYTLESQKFSGGSTVAELKARTPKDWTFEGSNDGATWDILDTQKGVSVWVDGVKNTFSIVNTQSYRKYRINITDNNGSTFTSIGEFEMLGTTPAVPATPSYWKTISTKLPSKDTFISDGMDAYDLLLLDRKPKRVEQNMTGGSILGSGRMFKSTIDLKKYVDIKDINVKK